jgi:hypothetical protein
MRQTMRLLLGILLLTSVTAFADSFNFIVHVNSGSGAGIAGLITGPGLNLTVDAGTYVNWFSDFAPGYAPGSIGGGGTPLYWKFELGEIDSQSYSPDQLFANPSFLTTGSFTFPTNGQNFTITMPASIDDITIVTLCPINCPTFDLGGLSGTLTLSFDYDPSNGGGYYANSGSFTGSSAPTPEPGTLGLVAMGIGALTWRRVKQMRTT